jgi:hypothetical protein
VKRNDRYAMNRMSRRKASQITIIPGVIGSNTNTASVPKMKIITLASRSITTAFDDKGLAIALMPIIRVRFTIVLPMMLENASCGLSAITAVMLDTISGRDVPIATIVNPINSSDTPIRSANFDADSTNTSDPYMRRKSPKTKTPTLRIRYSNCIMPIDPSFH